MSLFAAEVFVHAGIRIRALTGDHEDPHLAVQPAGTRLVTTANVETNQAVDAMFGRDAQTYILDLSARVLVHRQRQRERVA